MGALLVSERRAGVSGYRLLRPFSYVRAPNDSLGAPSWAALGAVLVDHGWFDDKAIDATPVRTEAQEQMFEEPVEIRGTIRRAPTVTGAVWGPLHYVVEQLHAPHYGTEMTGIVLALDPRS